MSSGTPSACKDYRLVIRWSTLRSDHRVIVQMIPHAEVEEFWHPSGVQRLALHDPVVYAPLRPPATLFVTLRVTKDFCSLTSDF